MGVVVVAQGIPHARMFQNLAEFEESDDDECFCSEILSEFGFWTGKSARL